ncbi:MAG: hypothetical protein JXM69_17970 [Anaerolineae bacterium]|nr:hypothetical protein [Anaerolineae bacterium]
MSKKHKRRRATTNPSTHSPPATRRLPAPLDQPRPVPHRPTLVPAQIDNPYVQVIAHLIRQMAATSTIPIITLLKDWLGMLESGLKMWPEQWRALTATGQFAQDPPDIQAIFSRARERYLRASAQYPAVYRQMQAAFSEAFALLLDSAAPGLAHYGQQTDLNPNVIGQVFLTCLDFPARWTPFFGDSWADCLIAAQAAIPDGAEQANTVLVYAGLKAHRAGVALTPEPGDNFAEWYEAVLPYAEPLLVGPPLVDSSAMLLAAAAQFPAWALESALVRVVWEPTDPLLRQMANINTMLFGLNGYRLAQSRALADVQAQLAQQADDPLDVPPLAVYPTRPPLTQETGDSTEPRRQAGHPSFADLFQKPPQSAGS